jgi:hypothetical protein
MLDDEELVTIMEQLTGIAEEKPFECIGTIDEVNLVLSELARKLKGLSYPALLDIYIQSDQYKPIGDKIFSDSLKLERGANDDDFLEKEEKEHLARLLENVRKNYP